MKNNYDYCITQVLKSEGGYTNDPNDSGGPTNYGITLGDYRKYIKRTGTAEDVKHMTVDQAKEIYRERYWNALDCDTLPSGVDYTCFDYGVNSGLLRPRNALKKFSGKTGEALIDAINDERTAFLKSIAHGKNAGFLRGWLLRVNRVRTGSKMLFNKKDIVTGPAAGTVATATAGLTSYQVFTQYIHSHPYVVVGAVVAVGIAVGLLVHYLRNKK